MTDWGLLLTGVAHTARSDVTIEFSGSGEGEAELTWGQVGFWQGMEQTGQSATMGGVNPMPAGITVEQLADLMRFVLNRHPSLRTRLRFVPDGPPRQVCSASGALTMPVIEVGDGDPAEAAERLKANFGKHNFDYENEWPIRQAVITRHGVVSHAVTIYLHLAIDAGGLNALLADLAGRDPVTGTAGPVLGTPPLEQSRRQQTPAVQRQSAASLKHLEHVMRTVTPQGFGAPKTAGPPSFQMIRYRSPATALAVARIVAEHGVNSSSAVLAAFAIGLARHTRDGNVMAMLMVSNRFRPGLADSVSALVQISPYLIDVAEVSLAQAVSRAGSSLLHTYKSAYYDPYRQDELVDRVNLERGEDVDFCCFYNDRREQRMPTGAALPTDAEIRVALAASSWDFEEQPDMSTRKLFVNVDDPPGRIDFQMSVDRRYFDTDDLLSVLRGIEAAAVQVVFDAEAPTGVPARVGQEV